ncbi:hypothetical protein B0T14DRAFT_513868 [Immersiella caudata]|uniref:Lectin n=1 Tax=Immersiella caudata TaxID=314043 RepID=A0AA39WVL2_9PEZI|nr:hypothetical protein B0T14DRAFT_513868 [Immersiella caudata]
MTTIVDGAVYRITNIRVPGSSLELAGGNPDNGTVAQIWNTNKSSQGYYNQIWVVRKLAGATPGQPDPYYFCNLRSGTCLDLRGGSSDNCTKLQGFGWDSNNTAASNINRLFWLNPKGDNVFTIINVKSGTAVDLRKGDSSNGTDVIGYCAQECNKNQLWVFQRLSLSSGEINAALSGLPLTQDTGVSHIMDKQYLCLPRGVINTIYAGTGLATTAWRQEIFDCDDFAFSMKAAVASSANKWPVRANGFALLAGFIVATKPNSCHAFNWFYLHGEDEADGKGRLEFFEPQRGRWDVNGFGYTDGHLVIY